MQTEAVSSASALRQVAVKSSAAFQDPELRRVSELSIWLTGRVRDEQSLTTSPVHNYEYVGYMLLVIMV